MDSVKFWLVFSVGVAAGAAVALIYAPQAGTKTRKQIRRKVDDATDYLKDQIDEAGDYLKDQASELGEKATKVYKQGKDAAANASGDVVDSLQAAVKNVKSSIA